MAKSMVGIAGYNERLFRGGLRRRYHMARFNWLEATARRLGVDQPTVIELGCFDGRALDHLPPVARYVGLDANWEGGLATAKAQRTAPGVEFFETRTPGGLADFPDKSFTMAVSLETLEHILPEMLDDYLAQIARVTDGPFLITVPTEIGPIFLAKHLAKLALYGDSEKYSLQEVVAATFGLTRHIARSEHKGFSYRQLTAQLEQWFVIERVEGVPKTILPPLLSLTVGIVAMPRRDQPLPRAK